MSSPIVQAIRQVCEEKGLTYESVMVTIEVALAAAYRKDFGQKNQNIKVEFDPESGSMRAFDVKIVVEDVPLEELEKEWEERDLKAEKIAPEAATAKAGQAIVKAGEKTEGVPEGEPEKPRFNPKTMIMISEARTTKPDAALEEEIRFELEVPRAFGRMAAQTAKQVITQKLREAERQTIFDEFKGREGEIIVGTVGRREGSLVLVDLGRTTAIMPMGEQIENEIYKPGSRLKFYLTAVNVTTKGPEIIVSRRHPEMLRKIFMLEIPEMQNNIIEVKNVAREAGARAKVAVVSNAANVDPIGACIGQRGSRIQTIISELGGEKIDVIKWEEDRAKFIINALSPAKVLAIDLNEEGKIACVKVNPDQLSLAIGRGGQNVRLASMLTGWKIKIEGQEAVAPPEVKAGVVAEGAPDESGQKTETLVEVVIEQATEQAQNAGGEGKKEKIKAPSKKKTKVPKEVKETGDDSKDKKDKEEK
ncbi:MAG: transcription termination factor NusA [bacterium]|nr:transcription termination factor NusA [bacterium]